ncbi:hypothetical protein AURDEDRAFT_173113 [Auricularia subglabra TFB-10046 SS5]|nr:hypothetical protein AURDEDRAFT_173113 [Auricularia subglabra TFB-10046 SS5]
MDVALLLMASAAPAVVLGSTFTMIGSFDDHTFFIPAPSVEPDGTAEKCADETNSHCDNIWWRERITGAWRGEITSTWGPDARLQLTFQGSGITIAGITDADGAQALGSIDDGPPTAANFASADGKRHLNATVFEAGSLDGTKRHVLNLWFDSSSVGSVTGQRRYMRINTFEAESPDDTPSSVDAFPRAAEEPFTPPISSSSTPFPSPSTTPTGTISAPTPSETRLIPIPEPGNGTASAHSNSQPHLETGTKVAIAVGVIVGVGVIAILVLVWRRIRRRAHPLPPPTSDAAASSRAGETIRIGQHATTLHPKQRALGVLSPSHTSESSVRKAMSTSTSNAGSSAPHGSDVSRSAPGHGASNPQLAALHATMDQVGISAASLREFLERLPRSEAAQASDRTAVDVPPPGYDRE